MDIRMILGAISIVVGIVLYASFDARDHETFHTDATVVSAWEMCVPLRRVGRHYYPHLSLPTGGVPCSETATLAKMQSRGYKHTRKYWQAIVEAHTPNSRSISAQVSADGKPLVRFQPGQQRDPEATNGLNNAQAAKDLKPGDKLPVAYTVEGGSLRVEYAPNELQYTQYKWIGAGVFVFFAVILFLFAGDGLPWSEEEKRYRDELREMYREVYGGNEGSSA